jgi:acetyltransferase-like isoleucine patch superfamily enzyme
MRRVWVRRLHFIGLYRLARRVKAKAFSLASKRSFAHFGVRSVIEPPLRVYGEERISIGDDVFIGSGSWLQAFDSESSAIEIGEGASMAGNCVLSAAVSIRIGKRVLFARNVYVADHMHAFEDASFAVLDQGIERRGPVEIGEGAWLGQNVVVGPGVRIGKGAVIGANSVVLGDIPERAVAVGAPARVVRILDSVREPAHTG